MSKDRYARAGVDLERAEHIVSRHAQHINATIRPGFHGATGGFGAAMELGALDKLGDIPSRDLILVSTTDGVGTKVKLAHEEQWHESIGQDCVAMCTNDVWAMGATPLWFMNYMGLNTLSDDGLIEELMRGMSRACLAEECMLVGGETAEMPGTYVEEAGYELAGFCVGGMSSQGAWNKDVEEHDWVLGLASAGMHSNGFSLVHQGVREGAVDLLQECGDQTLRRALLTPTRLYGEALELLRRTADDEQLLIKRAAHVTGGGLERAASRLMGEQVSIARLQGMIEPECIEQVREAMGLSWEEGAQVWNMGVGFLVVCDGGQKEDIVQRLVSTVSSAINYKVMLLGRVRDIMQPERQERSELWRRSR